MRRLENKKSDREFVFDLLDAGIKPICIIETTVIDPSASGGLSTGGFSGYITDIDIHNGYCRWNRAIDDKIMHIMNINCFTLVEYD